MSFILDALRKSETERQQQAGGEFSSVPSSTGESQSPKWLWMLALLLLVNVAVLLGILLRPDAGTETETPAPVPAEAIPEEAAPTPPEPTEQATAAEPSFEDRVAQAIEEQPPSEPVAEQPATPATSNPAPGIVPPPVDRDRSPRRRRGVARQRLLRRRPRRDVHVQSAPGTTGAGRDRLRRRDCVRALVALAHADGQQRIL